MSEAYQDLILTAAQRPRHRGALPDPARAATAVNRLCGDEVTVWLAFAADGRGRLGFDAGASCALCRASAEILAAAGDGRSRAGLVALADDFRARFPGRAPDAPVPPVAPDRPEAVAALYDLSRFPSRERCVLLAWEALSELLQGGRETMTRFTVERQGPVARIALKNPPGNTLDVPLMRELAAAVRGLAHEPPATRPRLLVLASAVQGQFSQGIDPASVLKTDVDGRKQVFLALGDLVDALWLGYVPILADVSGPALAGGAVLAALADFAIFDSQIGKICFSEPKVGLPLPEFVQRLVQRKVNPSAWNEVMILGKNVDAQEALRIGFANAVYTTPAERDEALASFAGRITRLPPAALTETLRQGRAAERASLERFKADLGAFADFLTEDYLGKGLRAVVKGEAPKF